MERDFWSAPNPAAPERKMCIVRREAFWPREYKGVKSQERPEAKVAWEMNIKRATFVSILKFWGKFNILSGILKCSAGRLLEIWPGLNHTN